MNTISSTERYQVVFQSTGGLVTDPKDLEPLTPDHLLLLRQEACLPPGVVERSQLYSRRRRLQVQYVVNVFWYTWKRE